MNTDDYLRLAYHIELVPSDSGDGRSAWVASVAEMDGCTAQGPDPTAAIARVHDAMRARIDAVIRAGDTVPMPRSDDDPSGRVLLRLPRSLHGHLQRTAAHEGVSLNQFVVAALASAVGWRAGDLTRH